MDYEHHVFISYRRELRWTSWTRDHFKGLLTSYLSQDLCVPPKIFVDEQTTIGADYVRSLGQSLAQSMVMVAVLSGDYFASQWCLHELDLMLDRNGGRPGLVVPVVVHDCASLPNPIDRMQAVDFKEFRILHMYEYGETFERFSTKIRDLAPQVCEIIRTAPNFDTNWVNTCVVRLNAVYDAKRVGTTVLPSHFVAPPPSPLKLPRLIIPLNLAAP